MIGDCFKLRLYCMGTGRNIFQGSKTDLHMFIMWPLKISAHINLSLTNPLMFCLSTFSGHFCSFWTLTDSSSNVTLYRWLTLPRMVSSFWILRGQEGQLPQFTPVRVSCFVVFCYTYRTYQAYNSYHFYLSLRFLFSKRHSINAAVYSTRQSLCIMPPSKDVHFWCAINDEYCTWLQSVVLYVRMLGCLMTTQKPRAQSQNTNIILLLHREKLRFCSAWPWNNYMSFI